ncbi:hypothetical protein KAR91_81710, partial [Candidatus Pacearchaeota archaeon]|nr:hypothetical protein [Candidatus Pacearchaeota archaeon]
TRKYYCESCAVDLNEYNRIDALRLYGHDLCTLDETDSKKQKIIEQAQQIAENGCSPIRNCEKECLLHDRICKAGLLFDYHDSKFVAQAFLSGIAFEKGDICTENAVKNPCIECGKEWNNSKTDEFPHCGNIIPF